HHMHSQVSLLLNRVEKRRAIPRFAYRFRRYNYNRRGFVLLSKLLIFSQCCDNSVLFLLRDLTSGIDTFSETDHCRFVLDRLYYIICYACNGNFGAITAKINSGTYGSCLGRHLKNSLSEVTRTSVILEK